MTTREWVEQYAENTDEPILLVGEGDEYDAALVGICQRIGQPPIALYDRRKLLEILAAEMVSCADEEDDPMQMALEHFEYNIIGGWVGEHTPAFADFPPAATIGEERAKVIMRPGLVAESRAACADCMTSGRAPGRPCYGLGIACRPDCEDVPDDHDTTVAGYTSRLMPPYNDSWALRNNQ